MIKYTEIHQTTLFCDGQGGRCVEAEDSGELRGRMDRHRLKLWLDQLREKGWTIFEKGQCLAHQVFCPGCTTLIARQLIKNSEGKSPSVSSVKSVVKNSGKEAA
jgi:hypothetical protein